MLGDLFRSRSFLQRDLEEWTLRVWDWLLRTQGGATALSRTPLVLANTDFFPPTTTEGEARAAYLFDCVKRHMGMEDWRCRLEPRERPGRVRLGEFWYVDSRAPAGTFQARGGDVVISYATDLAQSPRDLIAVFAHELSHYRLAAVVGYGPGGGVAHELITDLAVAFFGFGVFAANAAFSFQQHSDVFSKGWRSQRSGYLSERTWAFALALFLTLKDQQGAAKPFLKPHIAELTTKAERYLQAKPELVAPLRAIT